jgi:hypothetical protein
VPAIIQHDAFDLGAAEIDADAHAQEPTLRNESKGRPRGAA